MGIFSQGRPIWGLPTTTILTALIATACGSQHPSFKEDRSAQTMRAANGASDQASGGASADATAVEQDGGIGGTGSIESADAGGEGPVILPPGVGGDGTAGGATTASGGASDAGTDGGVILAGGSTTGGPGGTDGTMGGTDGTTGGTGGTDGTMGGTDGTTGGTGGEGGIDGAMRTVDVTQKAAGKVDILWVVDSSNSMSEEQEYLADNFNAMITQLNNAGHDFQTAITTTDVCQNQMPDDLTQRVCPADYGGTSETHLRGAFVGTTGHKVLHRGDSDLVSRFNSYAHVGTNGSGFEHGLYAARLAVEKSLNGQNEALVRSDAFLAVIVVSDEEDDGIGLSQTDAYTGYNFWDMGLTRFRYTDDDMISYLASVKGAGHFSVSAITGTRNADGSMCSSPHSQPAEEGTQYIKAAQKSGGILQSICETNWNASLANIGLDLDSQITQIALPSHPDVPTIHVTVNGESTSTWSYNAGNNAVKFDSGHVPPEGAKIQVTYYELL